MMKKTVALLLALLLTLSLAACGGNGNKTEAPGVTADTKPGDHIVMGKLDGEALHWTAVGAGVGTVLLVADNVIAYRAYNEEGNRLAAWKNSSVRAYLNGEFLNEVFTDVEREIIALTQTETAAFDDNTYETVTETAEDSVFLLSFREAARYISPLEGFRFGIPTQAAAEARIRMADVSESDTVTKACSWALRDDGETFPQNCMTIEGYSGKLSAIGETKTNPQGIRPAMWVYTDRALADGYKNGTAELPANEALDEKIASLKVGDTVDFGSATLHSAELICREVTWKVLDVTEDAVLIWSDVLLGYYKMGADEDENVRWANSEVRKYINSEDFINEYFDPWERAKIRTTHVVTCGSRPEWNIDGGEETDDKLFLLDREELNKYWPDEASRGFEDDVYWLRSPDYTGGWFSCVIASGSLSQNAASHYYGLRVAMWIEK